MSTDDNNYNNNEDDELDPDVDKIMGKWQKGHTNL